MPGAQAVPFKFTMYFAEAPGQIRPLQGVAATPPRSPEVRHRALGPAAKTGGRPIE
jgi:hypothetical protein